MATTKIDKKKQFQIQTVQSKLDNYKQTLQTLLDSHKKLTTDLALSNPNYAANLNNLNNLINNKLVLENNLKDLKSNITKIKNDTKKLTYFINDLPAILDNKNKCEETTLQQELERIELQKIENKQNYEASISQAHLDKLKLIEDISIIQNAIHQQNDIISQIQLNSHSSRKDTLTELHNKKKDKTNIINQQELSTQQDIFFNTQINEMQNNINNLESFKIKIVNDIYNTSIDSTSTDTIDTIHLINYYNEFGIDKELPVNDKISIIDNKILSCQNRINLLNKKLDRTKISNDARLNNIIENYNKTNRVKTITYKDTFKIEKEKKIQLQQVLDTLTTQYDNFENNIIANIKLDLTNANNELTFDINRANERLVIMKYRNNLDFELENNRITDEINISNIKINEMIKKINNINEELQNIKNAIEMENAIGLDIAKLDEEINKYKSMITQNETNIMLLLQ